MTADRILAAYRVVFTALIGVTNEGAVDRVSLIATAGANTRRAAATARRTSDSLVRQLHTLIRMTRRFFHVQPVNHASPVALIAAMTAWDVMFFEAGVHDTVALQEGRAE